MSWTRILVHLVFTTKDRKPLLRTEELRREVFSHIKENAMRNIILDCVNGYSEHVHCLLALAKDQNISQIARLIKGESSFWINNRDLIPGRFKWQDDYWAVSVGVEQIAMLRQYIRGQEAHHQKLSFAEEIAEIIKQYGGIRG
jgi:REP element-mobilizing transposase RayT